MFRQQWHNSNSQQSGISCGTRCNGKYGGPYNVVDGNNRVWWWYSFDSSNGVELALVTVAIIERVVLSAAIPGSDRKWPGSSSGGNGHGNSGVSAKRGMGVFALFMLPLLTVLAWRASYPSFFFFNWTIKAKFFKKIKRPKDDIKYTKSIMDQSRSIGH